MACGPSWAQGAARGPRLCALAAAPAAAFNLDFSLLASGTGGKPVQMGVLSVTTPLPPPRSRADVARCSGGPPATPPAKAHPEPSTRAPGVPCLGPAETGAGCSRGGGGGDGNNGEPVLGRPGRGGRVPVPAAGASRCAELRAVPGVPDQAAPGGGVGGALGPGRAGGATQAPATRARGPQCRSPPGKSMETDHAVTGQRRLEGSIIYDVVLTSPVWDFTSVARFPPICCSRPSFW